MSRGRVGDFSGRVCEQLWVNHRHACVYSWADLPCGPLEGIVLPVSEQLSTERRWFSTVAHTHGQWNWRVFAPISPVLGGIYGMTPSNWGTNTCGKVFLIDRSWLRCEGCLHGIVMNDLGIWETFTLRGKNQMCICPT